MQKRWQHLHVVLDAVIELVEQDALLRLRLLAVAHVDQHVDGADDIARLSEMIIQGLLAETGVAAVLNMEAFTFTLG